MRMIYFIVTSSLLILLTLFVRNLFRKKLSPGVIYALWLIPYLRLLVPLGFVEVPMFGVAAEFLNSPFSVTENSEIQYTHNDSEKIDVYNEHVLEEKNTLEHSGTKVYDAVWEMEQLVEIVPLEQESSFKITEKEITLAIWLLGASIISVYVIVQNRKLRKEADTLDVVEQIEGIDICLSRKLKTPCLVGVRNPRILITKDVYENARLYEYAVRHELAHFHQKDHFWNAGRIAMCVFYWWNPFVWYAAKCASEDAELACDARVLKKSSVEDRKNYGFALLELLEYAQNEKQNLRFATSVSGNRNSMKRRIQEISSKTTTRKYVLFPTLLLFVLLIAVGCVYPSDKSYIKTSEWKNGETEEFTYNEAKYKYSLQEEFQSILLYYEVYEYGELTKREILSYGDLETLSETFMLRHKSFKYEDRRYFVMEMSGIETSMPIPLFDNDNAYACSFLHSKNELFQIEPGEDLVFMATYQKKDSDSLPFFSCDELSTCDEEDLKARFESYNIATFARMILSDLPAEKLYEQMKMKEFPVEGENTNGRILAEAWVNAFIDKDVETILNLATEDVRKQLKEYEILDEEVPMFGWSSLWPALFTEEGYRIISYDNHGAEILYYASLSTPHVVVWRETLEFVNGQVSYWSLHTHENISSLNEYWDAYPGNQITDTPMDYYTNGLGEVLNRNALLSSSEAYKPLFDARTAALDLLNISRTFELEYYHVKETDNEAVVSIPFLNRDGSLDRVNVTMWQPYGKEGIWIPKSESKSDNSSNEIWSREEMKSLFLDKAESEWKLLDLISIDDYAYDCVGVVLYTENDTEFVNIGFMDEEGIIQHCGIEAVLDENAEFTYHGNGEVTFNVCTKNGLKYKQKIIFSKDADGVNFVSQSFE